jgi:hypothetical protein
VLIQFLVISRVLKTAQARREPGVVWKDNTIFIFINEPQYPRYRFTVVKPVKIFSARFWFCPEAAPSSCSFLPTLDQHDSKTVEK